MVKSHTHEFSWSGTTGSVSDKYGSANTNIMSKHSSGNFTYGGTKEDFRTFVDGVTFTKSESSLLIGMQQLAYSHAPQINMNIQHTHNYDHSHDYSGSGTTISNDNNSGENRPTNYTIRVWKRTA